MSSSSQAGQSPSKTAPETADGTAWFGDRTVPETEKAKHVHHVFANVARRYDIMNDVMSAGLHRLWKASLIDSLNPRPGMHLLDVAGGTGDIAFRFLEATDGKGHVTILDINDQMLSVGRKRAAARKIAGRADWMCGDAESLPLGDHAVDAYTIAFGIRNVTHIEKALEDAHRVLKFGGHFLCLEFCPRMAIPVLDRLYDRYSEHAIPRLGQWIANDSESYRYLVESIRRFPPPDDFAAMMRKAGFGQVSHRLLSGGICAIHSGWKL